MKVTYNWLKDFVDIKLSPKVLAEKLTMSGLEVTSLEEKNNDIVFEIEVTANRPDCLSVLGIAQEVAAITNTKVRVPRLHVRRQAENLRLKSDFINIKDKKGCVFYRGCLITYAKIGSSPQWLRNRIEAVGIRPVNNIVDITNYCLLEYGQPLHAFDYDKIIEKIIVRRARKKEKILTIDGIERELNENILVISDKNKSIAIAGVMGDKLSEVSTQTKNILLESAYFDPIIVRRVSRQLGLSTESSYRFERQVDFERVKLAQNRAIELICKIADGKFVDEKQVGKKVNQKSKQIKFDCLKANNLLSLNISTDTAKKIFSSLGFSCVKLSKDILSVKVPALRRDIKIEEDLVEELSRIYGYNKITSTVPAIRSNLIENLKTEELKTSLRDILCALSFNEVINYSLLSKDIIDAANINKEAIQLENPLSSEQEYLRPSLLSGLLNCLAYNLNHKNLDLKLFELGHIFSERGSEDLSLGLIATGKFMDNWKVKKEFDFFSLKGSIQNIIQRLGFGETQFLVQEENNMFISGQAAKIICQEKEIGIQGRIDNQILVKFGIKNPPSVYYAEIFLQELSKCQRKQIVFTPLAVFPSIIRDISLVVRNSIRFKEIESVVETEAGDYLKNIKLVDIYKGEQIPTTCIGLTISLEFGLPDRTLTDEEATGIQNRITKRLKTELAIEIR